jgi:hypothetical protein
MRVGVDHQPRGGFLARRRFTLNVHVEFSNEELAIIKTRALGDYVINLSPGYLASSESRHSPFALSAMSATSIVLFFGGLLAVVVCAFAAPTSALPILLLFGGPALWWYTLYASRREQSTYQKQISVAYLASNPVFSVQTVDPGSAPAAENNLLARLSDLRAFLQQTHSLTTPRCYEL